MPLAKKKRYLCEYEHFQEYHHTSIDVGQHEEYSDRFGPLNSMYENLQIGA